MLNICLVSFIFLLFNISGESFALDCYFRVVCFSVGGLVFVFQLAYLCLMSPCLWPWRCQQVYNLALVPFFYTQVLFCLGLHPGYIVLGVPLDETHGGVRVRSWERERENGSVAKEEKKIDISQPRFELCYCIWRLFPVVQVRTTYGSSLLSFFVFMICFGCFLEPLLSTIK